jgi:predicted RND superfamily exporter protein
MTKKQHFSFYHRSIRWCERQIMRFPWILLCVSLLLCGGTGYYVYNHLPVNTNTAEMLSRDLPFQQNQRRLDSAFPQDAATTILVVESNTPEETAQAAIKLASLRGIIFSSITTLCSFSSLSFFSHQGMASMGLLLSIGLFFTVICSLTVLPAFSGKRV